MGIRAMKSREIMETKYSCQHLDGTEEQLLNMKISVGTTGHLNVHQIRGLLEDFNFLKKGKVLSGTVIYTLGVA